LGIQKGTVLSENCPLLYNDSANKPQIGESLHSFFVGHVGILKKRLIIMGTVPNDRRKSRRDENCPHYYTALLEDSRSAHKKAMDRFADLGLAGRIVIVDNKTSAYTFGYPLDNSIFVVLLEVADLKIKGLSQFIFRRFCEELDGYKYINAMDDSGLENLKKVKMSYRPVKIERTYCVHA
jgi:hypothetical protein